MDNCSYMAELQWWVGCGGLGVGGWGLEKAVDATALTSFLFPWCCGDNAGAGTQGNMVTGLWFENVFGELDVSTDHTDCVLAWPLLSVQYSP